MLKIMSEFTEKMILSKVLINETYLIYEAKVDRLIYKIQNKVTRDRFEDLVTEAKQIFSGHMDYVNWFFDREVVIPDGKSDFNRFKNSWWGFKTRTPYRNVMTNFFYVKQDGDIETDYTHVFSFSSENVLYIILSYFNVPEKMCQQLENYFLKRSGEYLSFFDLEIKKALPKLIEKKIEIMYWGDRPNLMQKLNNIRSYYNRNIPGINNLNVTKMKNAVDLLGEFRKIHNKYMEDSLRLITLKERPQEEETLLLVCESNPNFEWYSFDVENAFECRSLGTCAANSASDVMWALREKQFNKTGELIGYISRFHVGFNENEKALKELKAYKNNKLSPKYFKYFADLAKSGLFKKIEIEESHKPENDLTWKDLSEDMLKDIIEENPNLLKTDEYLSDKFFVGKDWEMKEYYLSGVGVGTSKFKGRYLVRECIWALKILYGKYTGFFEYGSSDEGELENYMLSIKEAISKLENMIKNGNVAYEDVFEIMKEFESSIEIKIVEE